MARTSFLDKFSGRRSHGTRDSLVQIIRNVQALLNIKEGYGYFMPGFGLGGYTEKTGKGSLVEALAQELEEEVRQHEPRLRDVEVTLRGRDSALWLHFNLKARFEDKPCRLRLKFDTTTGQVQVENDEENA